MTTGEHLELALEPTARRVLAALDRERRAWLRGPAGSGRTRLLERLVAMTAHPTVVADLRELDEPDAVVGAVYSVAAAVEREPARRELLSDWSDPGEGIERAARELDPDTILAIKVPRSWDLGGASVSSDWEERRRRRAAAVLRAVAGLPLRVLWVTDGARDAGGLLGACERVDMAAPKGGRSLLVQDFWQGYAEHARRLHARLVASEAASPIAVRLALGLLALDEDLAAVVEALGRPQPIAPLADALARRLAAPHRSSLRQAVSALMLARRPVARSEVKALTDADDADLPFLCDVVAYGDDQIRMHAAVKRRLGQRLPPLAAQPSARAHRALASYFASLDGAADVRATWGPKTDAWLEKVRSLDLTPEGRGDVAASCREHYWSRGRYLSIERRDFAAAAEVYRACVERYPDDDYAWHYLGFNLERAGLDPRGARQAYEEAARREPTNPWWNSRRVTFLIGQGKPKAATEAWEEALASLDPEGDRVVANPWLAEECHYWVADAWLEVGNVEGAFAVLEAIPERVVQDSLRLSRLRQRVLDAVEADAIGESVYPETYPVERRWSAPRVLPSKLDGEPLSRWFPGRVLDANAGRVRVVYAERSSDGAYRSFVAELGSQDWQAYGLGPPELASGYVELGVYGEGERRLVVHAGAEVAPAQPEPRSLPLAYFDRWRSPG